MKPHWIQTLRIIYLVYRYNLDEFFLRAPYLKKISFLRWLNPFYLFSNRFIPRGQRLTLALQKAGPLFVKFGQILSTRHDLLPKDMIEHLIRLQDQVPPFSSKTALTLIDANVGVENFSHIETTPLASASIAQVHAATLKNGDQVVIKILRPNIAQLLKRDIALLRFIAKKLERRMQKSNKQISPLLMVDEIDIMLNLEINLINEAAHAEQLKENVKTNYRKNVYIPKIHWDYCSENILTLERIHGIPMMNISAIEASSVNRNRLAKECVDIFFTQIFHDNYFHADLHPGNIFINATQPENPIIELVDFGIVGSLPLKDRRYIAENMAALIDKDYRKVARLHRESGWIPNYVSEIAFSYAIQKVCSPILDKPLKDISLAQLLLGLIQAAKRYEIQLQPQLLLLQKTLLNIESLCRHLDPDFNIWEVAQPILKKWLREQLGPRAIFNLLKTQLPRLMREFIINHG